MATTIPNTEIAVRESRINMSSSHLSAPAVPKFPFPQRMAKYKNDTKFKRFIYRTSKVYINILLLEVVQDMAGYAKFMKDMITQK